MISYFKKLIKDIYSDHKRYKKFCPRCSNNFCENIKINKGIPIICKASKKLNEDYCGDCRKLEECQIKSCSLKEYGFNKFCFRHHEKLCEIVNYDNQKRYI